MCISLMDFWHVLQEMGVLSMHQVGIFNFTVFHEAQKPKSKEQKSRSRTE